MILTYPVLGSTFVFEVYPLPKGKYSFDDVNMWVFEKYIELKSIFF